MKPFLILYLLLFLKLSLSAQCSQFQNNLVEITENSHYKDLNTLELDDNSHDFVISGTKFTDDFTQEQLFIVRVDELNGSIVWKLDFDQNFASRGFDMVRFQENNQEQIAVTGYVNDGNLNHMYIAIVDASNGAIVRENAYEIAPNLNSQGLHIIYTEKDFNGAPEPGFIVAGFYNFIYDVNTDDNGNGFVMRTDINLVPLWTQTSETQTGNGVDYDMMNRVTETSDGFFVTGSVNEPNGNRQGILMSKFDGEGNTLWINSYVQGNFRDVGVDAYYDTASDLIYLLVYYSNFHYFGITTIDNTSGSILLNNSWSYFNGNQLNRTGFKITESTDPNFPDDLVVLGYERDALVEDPSSGNTINSNTLPFAASINKTTGSLSFAYNYPVPYQDNSAYQDFFRFWDNQSPLIFHPEIGFTLRSGTCSFMVANRSYGLDKTAIEMIQLNIGLKNLCERDTFTVQESLINLQLLPTAINSISVTPVPVSFSNQTNGLEVTDCAQGGLLSVPEKKKSFLKLYPNPTSDFIYLTSDSKVVYKIYDQTGKLLLKGERIPPNGINVITLKTGIYFIALESENSVTEVQKFVKE